MAQFIVKKNKRRISFFQQLTKFFGIYVSNKNVEFKIKFTDSCIYNSSKIEGINKLFGLTFGLGNVHKSSARFGWQPNKNNKIELYAYVYEKSVRSEYLLGEIDLNVDYILRLIVTTDSYVFEMDGKIQYVFTHETLPRLSYLNFIYFGGIQAAPHDMTIEISKI